LKRAKVRGKAVLAVEYLSDNSSVAAEIRSHGFVPNFAKRGLSALGCMAVLGC
jgi:hypothetical protein